jgi:tetratricopeptide (TPR) repeat protein
VDPISRQARSAQTLKGQGDEQLKAGRYADAERCYRQEIESDAQHPTALVNLGFVLREQGRGDDAREVLERAVRIADDDADGHYLLGCILETQAARETQRFHICKRLLTCAPASSWHAAN